MRKCPYCGKDNADNVERCEHCCAGILKESKDNADKKPEKVSNQKKK